MPKKYAFQAMEEIGIMGSLNSRNIVTYVDSFVNGDKVSIIMEYCENGDLESLIKASKLTEGQIWRYFLQICLGLNHMHS
jgi:serine/threonine protein kinase